MVAYLNVTDLKSEEYLNSHFVVLCTKKGVINKTTLSVDSCPRSNGIIAVGIREGDESSEARLTNGKHHRHLGQQGWSCRPLRRRGCPSDGPQCERGARYEPDRRDQENEVIGMITMDKDELNTLQVLVVSSKGYGKRTAMLDEDGDYVYRMVNRGGKGVKTMQLTDKTGGELVAIKSVKDEDQLLLSTINRSGMTIRMDLSAMRVLGRATQGVRLIELRKNDQIAAVAKIIVNSKRTNPPKVKAMLTPMAKMLPMTMAP